jgi:hypothetical protein
MKIREQYVRTVPNLYDYFWIPVQGHFALIIAVIAKVGCMGQKLFRIRLALFFLRAENGY